MAENGMLTSLTGIHFLITYACGRVRSLFPVGRAGAASGWRSPR